MLKPFIVCIGPDCTFSSLITLVQNLIYNLIVISTFLAIAAFAYAGFILLTSGGSEGKRDKAKDVFWKVLKGYLWILGAWLLVYTITSVLLQDGKGFSILGAPR